MKNCITDCRYGTGTHNFVYSTSSGPSSLSLSLIGSKNEEKTREVPVALRSAAERERERERGGCCIERQRNAKDSVRIDTKGRREREREGVTFGRYAQTPHRPRILASPPIRSNPKTERNRERGGFFFDSVKGSLSLPFGVQSRSSSTSVSGSGYLITSGCAAPPAGPSSSR